MTWRLTADALEAHASGWALIGLERRMSYRVLAGRAQAVADLLEAAGVKPGARVALLSAGRGHDEAVGLVGIRLAGGVVVPLDASHPPERWARLTKDCRAMVTDEGAASKAPALPRVELDAEGFVLGAHGDVEEEGASEGDVTVVLHTSGSTGTPKAIPITTEGLDAFTAWMIELVGLEVGTRVLRVAELGFDLAWFDHLATFRAGSSLCTLPRRRMATGRSLREGLEKLRPEVIYGVPSFFQKLVDAGFAFEGVRTICFAGEVYPMPELRRLAAVTDARLVNLFGPTETNVCTFHVVRPEDLERDELPIGIACPYATCEVVGSESELVVTGPTAMGGRCATRDRVERREGLFWFRGRLDRMVKIRGYRVDPGEVEAALHQQPGVVAAAVVSEEHPRLGTTLVAHVEGTLETRGLRKALAASLPPYMVPERVVPHATLPRTSTGKIDYRAL